MFLVGVGFVFVIIFIVALFSILVDHNKRIIEQDKKIKELEAKEEKPK